MTTSARGSGLKSGRVVTGVQAASNKQTRNAEGGTRNSRVASRATTPTLLFRVPRSAFRVPHLVFVRLARVRMLMLLRLSRLVMVPRGAVHDLSLHGGGPNTGRV